MLPSLLEVLLLKSHAEWNNTPPDDLGSLSLQGMVPHSLVRAVAGSKHLASQKRASDISVALGKGIR